MYRQVTSRHYGKWKKISAAGAMPTLPNMSSWHLLILAEQKIIFINNYILG